MDAYKMLEINGFVETTLPDLKVTDLFKFDDDSPLEQYRYVTYIAVHPDRPENILVYYIPEYTPVRSPGIYHYGTKNIIKKPK